MKKKNEASNALNTAQKVISIAGGIGSVILTGLQIKNQINGKK